jgi:hypothetical protein
LRRLLDDPRTDADPVVRAWAKVGLAQLAAEHGAGVEEIGSAAAGDAQARRDSVRRLGLLYREAGIALLPRERAHLGADESREIEP